MGLPKSPYNARVFNNLGYAYAIAGRYKEAERAYSKALELKPDYWIARNNLTKLLMDKKK
ncbi:MAG: tetratricopeptide repeat protein [bacterium]